MEQNYLLIESAWEVCSQLGGIYTVLRSKAPVMTERWGDRYCMMGPYEPNSAATEFDEQPCEGIFGMVCQLLAEENGIHVKFGRRLITGRPQAVLFDLNSIRDKLGLNKYLLWKDHGIETTNDGEVDDVVLFGYAVADYLEILIRVIHDEKNYIEAKKNENLHKIPILAHFHEWMAGVTIPVIKKRNLPVKTVFTTHATLLGRYIASDDPNFYEYLSWVAPDAAASAKGIYPRFAIERAAANGADCFTTVSDVTGVEAEHLLGRKSDILLPNGLNINRFAAMHEFQILHQRFKREINEFVMGHFFPYYTFDLNQTLYFFTSGRYEYKNKGLDLFIEALARLNWRLKNEKIPVTIVVFIVTKAAIRGINVDVLKSKIMFDELENVCNAVSEQMKTSLLEFTARGIMPGLSDLIGEYERLRIKRIQHAWKRHGWPSICTHDMIYDGEDPVLNQLRSSYLLNSPGDPVKVIFHPEFLTATGPLLGLDYDQFVRGCHLGVFPSYYEPWGYTPMECAAFGVPSVTSDLSGFGSYISKEMENCNENGYYIVGRKNKNFHESADHLADIMMKVARLNRRERIDLRNRVESESVMFDWKEIIKYYIDAYEFALRK